MGHPKARSDGAYHLEIVDRLVEFDSVLLQIYNDGHLDDRMKSVFLAAIHAYGASGERVVTLDINTVRSLVNHGKSGWKLFPTVESVAVACRELLAEVVEVAVAETGKSRSFHYIDWVESGKGKVKVCVSEAATALVRFLDVEEDSWARVN